MSCFVELYSALWNRMFGLDRYAKIKSQTGQQLLFGDGPSDHPAAAPRQPSTTPWTATGYQGTGRQDPESVYKHGPGAVFRGANYFAFSPEHARKYGPEVSEHQVTLQNPLHITSDEAWHQLAAEAGVKPSLNMGSMDQGAIRQASDALQAHVQSKGHDGLVVRGSERTKWPARIFGHDQVVQFGQGNTNAMIPRPASAPATTGKAIPPNHVIAEVRDHEGNLLGHEFEPHDGTPDGIRHANSMLRGRLEVRHPNWSNVMTRTGATNDRGAPAWAVSPNSRNVYEVGSQEARDLMGWTSSDTTPKPRISQPPAQYAAQQGPATIYRGTGRNIGYSAVPGVQWWSLDPEIAAHYGDVQESKLHPAAKVLHLEGPGGHNPQGIDELEQFANQRGIEFDRPAFESMTGEEYFGQRGHPQELMGALRDHGYHAIHTSNIEGPATMVLDQRAFTGPETEGANVV